MRFSQSFGDVISDVQAATDSDTVMGLKALHYFWQDAMTLNPQIPSDFPTFLAGLKNALVPATDADRWPGYVGPNYPNNGDAVFKVKIAGIGNMANVGGTAPSLWDKLTGSGGDVTPMTDDQVQASMQALAQQGGGKIPTDFNSFAAVFTNVATQVNFFDALWYTVAATAHDVGAGAAAAGQGLLDAGSTILAYKNYIMLGAAALASLILYMRFVPKRVKTNPKRSSRNEVVREANSTRLLYLGKKAGYRLQWKRNGRWMNWPGMKLIHGYQEAIDGFAKFSKGLSPR